MEYSKKTLYEIFHGIHELVFTDTGIWPARMTLRQREYFTSKNESFAMRAYCDSGIYMDFYTDAERISFDYTFGLAYRKQVAFDIYENDVLVYSYMCRGESSGRIEYIPNSKSPRITVYFPCIAQIFVSNLSLGCVCSVKRTGKKLMFLGDSIAQGVDCGSHPSMNLPNLYSRFEDCEYINLAVGSAMFCPDFIDQTLNFVPDVIFVAYGANDTALTVSDNFVRQNTDRFFSVLRDTYSGIPIIAISPIWYYREAPLCVNPFKKEDTDRWALVYSVIESCCEKYGIKYICGRTLMPHLQDFYRTDDPHPTEIGFSLYASELYRVTKNFIFT
ncbi:MAG: GDSL-type esterase/lipase family protein [Oscillospiraceae bacterium]|nr:GDSL-type esterase/lipase family protein [Oscillospiraceae bacterium]